jgi:signal transduction histidine kinase
MSLRVRLALTFALIVAISLLVVAVSLIALLRGYSERLVAARLNDLAGVAAIQARGLLARGQRPVQVLDFLGEQAERLEVRILLTDRQGRVVRETGQGSSLLDARVPLELDRDPVVPRQPIQGSFSAPRGGEAYQYAAVPLTPGPGRLIEAVLVVAQPEGSPLATLRSLLPRLGLAAGAGLLAGLLAAILLARWLGQPLGRLLAATQAMARGDYSQRVEPGGPPELVRLAESYNDMSAEVERSRLLIGRFVSTLSHELRTPLTSIRGFAQAVLDGSATSPEAVQRAMRVVDREARRMQRLSSELLDLSRLQTGRVPMRREPLDLGELIRHCVEVLEVRAQEQRVRLALELPDGLAVEGDADRLEQVFTNLLDNALKFTPADQEIAIRGQHLSLTASASRPDVTGELRRFGRARTPPPTHRPGVLIEIANPGPPIPPDELPRIFEQFYTGGDGRERGGTGLGLPIAREISRAHGGDLTATSQLELTTFQVWLPASSARRDDAVTAEPLTRTPVR